MSTRCDNCNDEVGVPIIGTIKGIAFNFCSFDCRAEFARFSQSVGHAMVIPAAPCDERDKADNGQTTFLNLASPACTPVTTATAGHLQG